jgi:hypothetical protein
VGDILQVSQVDANVEYWQVTACFLNLNYRRPNQAEGEEQMNTGTERRKSERISCETPILHNTSPADFFYKGTMYNFSKGGLYFETNEDLLQGHEIAISIKKPPQQFISKSDQYFDVKIMWCIQIQGSSYQLGYGAKLI